MRKRCLPSVCVVIVSLVLGSPVLLADSFRCGNYLIQEDMPAGEVREKCGEPTTIETRVEPVMARRSNGTLFQAGETTTEYWTYQRGAERFPVRLTIEEGVAKRIELLRRH